MKSPPEESICVFGATAILKYVQDMTQEIEGVRQAQDIECIHRMRVASRRLRTTLPLFPRCLPAKKMDTWQKQIREITRALGAARDADVQIESLRKVYAGLPMPAYRSGIRRLLLRRYQRRVKLQSKVVTALDHLESNKLLSQLEQAVKPASEKRGVIYIFTPALYNLAFDAIRETLDRFLGYDAIVDQPDEVEELHAMRIAAKGLRYTLETFASLYPEELKSFIQVMRKAQDALGEIHDCDVWDSFLPQFLIDEQKKALKYYGTPVPARRLVPGIQYFQEDRKRARQKEYENFVKDWERWRSEGVWEDLQRTIRLPFFVSEEVSPILTTAPKPERENEQP